MTKRLNLGCGNQRLDGYICLDILLRDGVDVLCDFENPLPIAAESVDHVYAKSLLEHIDELESFLGEVLRVLKINGTIYFYVPHWSNPFYYSDYTHVRYFGLATFDYFVGQNQQIFRRVPTYHELPIQIRSIRLLFGSPFRGLNILMKGFQWLMNRSKSLQLFYEFHLSALVPRYAIEYQMKKP